MDLLPKHMCHRCSYKLEEFHKFYVDCLKTDAALKNQLSWMQKGRTKEKVGVPMVHIENVNIKTEPLDYDVYELEPIVENIDYINSMTNSVAFPAGGIHDGLTYAAFSRCRCCCDKKDQSKRTSVNFCRNYEESVARCVAEKSQRRTLEAAHARLRPAKRKALACAVLQDRPKNHLLRVNAPEDARVRLLTAETKDMSSLNTRNRSYDRLRTVIEGKATSRNTIVRNLRPRQNSVNYTPNKKKISNSSRERPSTEIESNIINLELTSASNLKLIDEIKIDDIEAEERSLRPRKNVVDYCEPKIRKKLMPSKCEQKDKLELAHRMKKRKADETEQISKSENILNGVKLEIKETTTNDTGNTMIYETTSAMPVLSKNRIKITRSSIDTKIDTLEVNVDATGCLKSGQSQSRSKSSHSSKEKPIDSNIVKNNLAKLKKINRSSTSNYSPKCLRSQDIFLRNGKRKYVQWSMKRLQVGRKLINTMVAKEAKKVPATLNLTENIKHYCESCNTSFMNKELFKLHACYYN